MMCRWSFVVVLVVVRHSIRRTRRRLDGTNNNEGVKTVTVNKGFFRSAAVRLRDLEIPAKKSTRNLAGTVSIIEFSFSHIRLTVFLCVSISLSFVPSLSNPYWEFGVTQSYTWEQ